MAGVREEAARRLRAARACEVISPESERQFSKTQSNHYFQDEEHVAAGTSKRRCFTTKTKRQKLLRYST